jgi:PAS domain S-box-containing protein
MLEPEKTKEQLAKELEEMRRRVEQLQDAWEKNEESKRDLSRSENIYRSLFEDSLEGLFEVAEDGTILDANTAYLKLFGYTREEILNTNIVNLYFEQQDRELYRNEIQKTGYVRDYPLRMITKNGRRIDCEVTATAQKSPDGTLISYRGILRDVTDRNESKKVLEKVEKNYR